MERRQTKLPKVRRRSRKDHIERRESVHLRAPPQAEKSNPFGVWLGLHRKADNKFYWADDTLLTGYNAWFTREPNSLSEKCGHMWGTGSAKGRWNDVYCSLDVSRHAKDAPVILCQKKANH